MNDEQTRTFLAIAAGLGATEVSLVFKLLKIQQEQYNICSANSG